MTRQLSSNFLLFQEQTPNTNAGGINHLDDETAVSHSLEKLCEDSFFVKQLRKRKMVNTLKDISNEVDFTSLDGWTQTSFWITIQVIAELIPWRTLEKVPMKQLVNLQLFLGSTTIKGYLCDSFDNILSNYLHSYNAIDIIPHILGTYMGWIPELKLVKDLLYKLYVKTNFHPDKITSLLCPPQSSHKGMLRLGKWLCAQRRNVWRMLTHQFSDDCEVQCHCCDRRIYSDLAHML